nr:hypothetical protein [Nitrosomonas nitrosa]
MFLIRSHHAAHRRWQATSGRGGEWQMIEWDASTGRPDIGAPA